MSRDAPLVRQQQRIAFKLALGSNLFFERFFAESACAIMSADQRIQLSRKSANGKDDDQAMLMMPLVIQAMADDEDRQLMETLYTAHHRLMLATAWKYTRAQAEVEDIVSDSCVSLIKKIETLREMDCHILKSYIVSTVRNTAIDHCRKQQRTNARFQDVEDEAMERVADQTDVEKQIALRDELESVRQALDQLPTRERDVLRLKLYEEKKDSEIAAIVGLSESSVRKYVIRARQHLKTALYEGGGE